MSLTSSGLKYSIDNSGDKFGAKTTIADIAVNSFAGICSDDLSIYRARNIVQKDWNFELADFEYEYGVSMTAEFKDGSKLTVCAWYMEPLKEDE